MTPSRPRYAPATGLQRAPDPTPGSWSRASKATPRAVSSRPRRGRRIRRADDRSFDGRDEPLRDAQDASTGGADSITIRDTPSPGRDEFLHDIKGGSLRSPPAARLRAAAGGRPRRPPRARARGRVGRARVAPLPRSHRRAGNAVTFRRARGPCHERQLLAADPATLRRRKLAHQPVRPFLVFGVADEAEMVQSRKRPAEIPASAIQDVGPARKALGGASNCLRVAQQLLQLGSGWRVHGRRYTALVATASFARRSAVNPLASLGVGPAALDSRRRLR
jgi:hypothetical protein